MTRLRNVFDARKVALPALLLVAAGCTHLSPHFAGMSYDAAGMDVVGPATGYSEGTYLFGVLNVGGKDSAIEATAAAVASVKADALVDVTVDEKSVYAGLLTFHSITVSGTAVRYKKKVP